MAKRPQKPAPIATLGDSAYDGLLAGAEVLLSQARVCAARVVNGVMTAAYYELGRRIVECDQGGQARADYGESLLARLGEDLTRQFGRGYGWRNLSSMRTFYLGWEIPKTPPVASEVRAKLTEGPIAQTPSAQSATRKKLQTASAISVPPLPAGAFPLSWSHYVRLMTVPNLAAREFYEEEAVRGGWSVRQLDRHVSTQFYQRLGGSKRKAALLANAHDPAPADRVSADELVRDPYVLEFLNPADEYGEGELEEAIVRNLEGFLVELGRGFTFVARQRKIRIDSQWYKIDLLLFHRRLRCLVVIDLKIGPFGHADAGQMNLYLNYAKEHLTEPGEGDPVGLILCSEKSDTVVRYAMGGINAKVFASEYLTLLPGAEELRATIERTRQSLAARPTKPGFGSFDAVPQ